MLADGSLPQAERYSRFRDEIFAGLAEHPFLPGLDDPLSELDLQSLWFSGAFGTHFTTTDGRSLTMQDFGAWNAGAGPDFTDCAMLLNGAPVRGDIELDTDVRDWERHGHGANADYRRVVLHVFLEAPAEGAVFTRTSDHREVAQVRVSKSQLLPEARPKDRLAAARLGRCAEPLRGLDPSRIQDLIECAAQHRLRLKSNRLHALVASHGREQAIYQALAQALGYRSNQRPFVILSQRLPLRKLLKLRPDAREALLFGVSGFLEDQPPGLYEAAAHAYLVKLWSNWWKQRSECLRWLEPRHLPRWRLSAVRPGNHPQRRVGALAALLADWPAVSAPLLDATRWSQASWVRLLSALDHPFWATHYTLRAAPATHPVALIGSSRIHELLANVVYPLLVPERSRLWAEYLELPALLDNQKVRRACLRLFGKDQGARHFQRKLHHQQGLLQIYEDFCLEDHSGCADCPFPERLREWS
jgi:hypothetical protein